jgi:hypothetical protein
LLHVQFYNCLFLYLLNFSSLMMIVLSSNGIVLHETWWWRQVELHFLAKPFSYIESIWLVVSILSSTKLPQFCIKEKINDFAGFFLRKLLIVSKCLKNWQHHFTIIKQIYNRFFLDGLFFWINMIIFLLNIVNLKSFSNLNENWFAKMSENLTIKVVNHSWSSTES